MRRKGGATEIRVSFGPDSPAICKREDREGLRRKIRDFDSRSRDYQEKLDAVLIEHTSKSFRFQQDFPFRWSSAGTLPIVSVNGAEYYCLFYREIFPVGWNIANGACDSLAELRNPFGSLERELGEELMILDLRTKTRYVVRGQAGALLDRPEFDDARHFWMNLRKDLDIAHFSTREAAIKWSEGPDRAIVKVKREKKRELSSFS